MEIQPDTSTSAPPSKRSAAARQRRHDKHNRNVQREINQLQRSPDNIIPMTSFSRIIREMLDAQGDYSIRADAMRALQYAAEDHVTDMFQDANNLALYSGRETVTDKDLQCIGPTTPPMEETACSALPLIAPDQ